MKTYIATHKLLGELAVKGIPVNIIYKEKFLRNDYLCSVIEYTDVIEKYLTRGRKYELRSTK